MSDKFVGKVIKIEIGDRTYRMKSPPSKHIPKLMTLQGKNMETLDADQWEIIRAATFDAIKKANPEWTDEEVDEFIMENFMEVASKLPVVMGWVTEEELKTATKKKAPPSPRE